MLNRCDLSKVGGNVRWQGERLFYLAGVVVRRGLVVDDPRNYDKLDDQHFALMLCGDYQLKCEASYLLLDNTLTPLPPARAA